ncbi:sodium-dependent transporter [Marinobacterium sp. D7]|uniref:sodium-dependent transporter n=1 Tax=Marinobacterium ramblicola TaxID=2849041 RepID=UPI001C2D2C7F|nr:sodium-dependent transporter [Marinobacterium ramblicola]MBV1789103.1 sodium-dependent transporter [Marinobacterium ramblicola]
MNNNSLLADSVVDSAAVESASPAVGRSQWSTRLAFILAATGSAVGLGNIWKFPYITGENGGGAFVLLYLGCIALIGIPLLMAEILIGRRGKHSPPYAMKALAAEAGVSSRWQLVGWVGVITGFMLLSFYLVVAGWAVAYIFNAGSGAFTGASGDEIGGMFGALIGDPWVTTLWGTLVLAITAAIVIKGVKRGLERAVGIMMPGLLLILLLLVGYAMTTGQFARGFEFMFSPDFSKLTGTSVLVALGHAFFSLSLAGGGMMTYGSYLPKRVSLGKTVMTIGLLDTLVALIAGLAIFPIVFANGLEPGAGPGLIFVTLPLAFGQMPLGQWVGVLFFVMLSFAALTSAISLLEPAVSWLTEKRGFSRLKAGVLTSAGIWLLSLGSVFSFNIWAEHKLFGKNFFEVLDYLTSGWIMPLSGLAMAIFTGWIMSRAATHDEVGDGPGYRSWRFLVRYIVPVGILAIFLNAIGVLG